MKINIAPALFVSALTLLTVSLSPVLYAEQSVGMTGQQVFNAKCKFCHAVDAKLIGPAVRAMANDENTLSAIISKGKGSMPRFEGKLSAQEISATVFYILEVQSAAR